MAKVSPGFTNFTRGELSPLCTGRVDYQGYFDGATELTNFLVRVQGPITRRPGSMYVATAKGGTSPVRVIPFEFSTEQAYVLEFGDYYIRVFRDRGQVLSSGGTTAYEIATPYPASDIFDIKYTQSADTVYLAHPKYRTQKLTRTGHTSWSIAGVTTQYGPALDTPAGASMLTASSVTKYNPITITAGATVFYPGHVGSVWRWDMGSGTSGYFTITEYGSGVSVTAIAGVSLAAYSTYLWGEAAWSDYRGWPSCVKFHENRLMYGRTDNSPTSIWGSVIGQYDNFWTGILDEDGLSFTTQNLNAIRWLESTNSLLVGTTGGVLKVAGPSVDDPLNYQAVCKTQSQRGCANILPQTVGETIMYVDRSGRKLRELSYSLERDGYVAPDRTIVAEHITRSGVSDISYTQEPDSVLWCGLKNGEFATFTYEPDEKVLAWASQQTEGVIESHCVIPGVEEDELWISVIRTVGGVDYHYIEYFTPQHFDTIYDCFYVDSGLSRTGAGTTVQYIALPHLAGCTIDALVDGMAHPQVALDAIGGVTLQFAGTTIHAGLPYVSTYRSVNLEGGSRMGTAIGKIKRVIEVVVRFYNTVAGQIGFDDADLGDIPFRTDGLSLYGKPTALFSGDKKLLFKHGYDTEAYIQIVQDKPLPMTILNVVPTFDTREK
jgi:hypothetical protein